MSFTGVTRFNRRSGRERRLLAHAVVLHTLVVVACRVVRYGRLTHALSVMYALRIAELGHDDRTEAEIAWAVATAAYLVPLGSTCLTRALTAQCLLRRYGHPAALCFGVREGVRPLAAHAWLESDGRPVAGFAAVPDYLLLD